MNDSYTVDRNAPPPTPRREPIIHQPKLPGDTLRNFKNYYYTNPGRKNRQGLENRQCSLELRKRSVPSEHNQDPAADGYENSKTQNRCRLYAQKGTNLLNDERLAELLDTLQLDQDSDSTCDNGVFVVASPRSTVASMDRPVFLEPKLPDFNRPRYQSKTHDSYTSTDEDMTFEEPVNPDYPHGSPSYGQHPDVRLWTRYPAERRIELNPGDWILHHADPLKTSGPLYRDQFKPKLCNHQWSKSQIYCPMCIPMNRTTDDVNSNFIPPRTTRDMRPRRTVVPQPTKKPVCLSKLKKSDIDCRIRLGDFNWIQNMRKEHKDHSETMELLEKRMAEYERYGLLPYNSSSDEDASLEQRVLEKKSRNRKLKLGLKKAGKVFGNLLD